MPITLDVIHETFLVAALICALTVAAVFWMRAQRHITPEVDSAADTA